MDVSPCQYGDVRIFCDEPDLLRTELHLSRIALVDTLPDREWRIDDYSPGALVPDPATIRAATPEEAAVYIRPLEECTGAKNEVVVRVGEAVVTEFFEQEDTNTWIWFRGASTSPQGELTTTLTHPSDPQKEGMHFDSDIGFLHRLGICIQGPRQLLVVTHSGPELFGPDSHTNGKLRELVRVGRLPLGMSCLHVPLYTGSVYDAWTGWVVHDGSTQLSSAEEPAEGPSQIKFVRREE